MDMTSFKDGGSFSFKFDPKIWRNGSMQTQNAINLTVPPGTVTTVGGAGITPTIYTVGNAADFQWAEETTVNTPTIYTVPYSGIGTGGTQVWPGNTQIFPGTVQVFPAVDQKAIDDELIRKLSARIRELEDKLNMETLWDEDKKEEKVCRKFRAQ